MEYPRMLRALALTLSLIATSAAAQVSFQEEYTKLVNGGESISAQDGGLFGDSVSLATGAVEFSATDVSLPGNSAIPVTFGRRRSVETGHEPNFMMADWDIDIPFIEGVYGQGQGWIVNTGSPTQRCSSPASTQQIAPPNLVVGNLGAIGPRQFWQGIHLQVPGQGRQEILVRSGSVPTPNDGQDYRYITSGFWLISCAATLASGQAGEGFVARSPDGMTYTFDWMVTSSYPSVLWPRFGGNYAAPRARVRLYPTTVVDRHNNSVTYHWLGDKLQSITSNDGRSLSIHYNTQGRVDTVKDNSTPQRTWNYSYSAGSLQSVLLPDNSHWQFDFAIGIGSVNYDTSTSTTGYDTALTCNWMRKLLANERSVTITHPSGAIGTFKFDVKRHGRANIDTFCNRDEADRDARNDYPDVPARFDTWSLVSKRIEGPGLPGPSTIPPAQPYEWTYFYTLPTGNFTTSPCGEGCPTTKTVEVRAPDGSRTISTFGIDFSRTDNQLLSVQTLSNSGEQIRLENYAYVLDGQATPFPDRIGSTPQTYSDDSWFGERLRPQKQRTILQGGVTFSSNTTQFDTWAFPVSVTKSSALGSKSEVSTYEHNTGKWVLGQLKTLSVDGKSVSEVVYSPTTALPIRTYAFGKPMQTLDYYDNSPGQDGSLRSVTDGNNHTISFSDYYRGIARRVDYPTGKWKTAEVNNQGTIESITDELGNSTHYDYYPDGRLWKIRYPLGDTPAWNEKFFAFEKIGSAYGMGGHWRQTVTQGNARKTTDYDALWRPVVLHEEDTVNGSGRFTVHRYDHAGRDQFTSYPVDTLTEGTNFTSVTEGISSTYDVLGRLISTSQTSELGVIGTSVSYAPIGFKKTVRNGLNQATTFSFLAFDEPSENWPTSIIAPETLSVSINRDAFGKPLSITRSGTQQSNGVALSVSATRSYVYDSYQQLCKTIEPEIGATVVDYDGAGNVAWSAAGLNLPNPLTCDRNALGIQALRSNRSYDELNRPLDTTFADGSPAIRRTYWGDGQLRTVRTEGLIPANNTQWTYDYNKLRLPTFETLALDGRTYSLENRYNANGHLKTLVYPDLVEVDYAPNALGEPTGAGNTLKNYASAVTTWPNGAIKGFTYGNGVVHSLTQNARRLPQRSRDSSSVLDDTYGYDANGNGRSIADAVSGTTRTMQYDDLDRLETMTSPAPWSNSSYVYDALDNVRASTVGGRSYTHAYNSSTNLLEALKVGGLTAVGYNHVRGNVTQRGTQTFLFDQANRLVSKAGESARSDETYVYDGHGRRVKVVRPIDGSSRHILYSLSGQLRFEANLAANTLTDYIYLGGSLVAREESVLAVTAPPAPVVTAPANDSTGTYTVSWPTPTATSYVFEENREGAGWVVQSSGPVTSITLTLRGNGNYQYRAKAYNAGGWSGYSAVVTTRVTNVPSPPTPSGIAASPNPSHTGTFEVRWPASGGATQYRLWENANNTGWAQTPVFLGDALAYAVTGRVSGSYQYRVEACSASCSLPTTAVTVSVIVTAGVPAPPVLTVPSTSSTGNYAVSWTQIAGATYELQELGPDWAWVTRYSGGALTQSYTRSAGTYAYRVRACKAVGCGDFGPASSIVVALVNVPPTPLNLTATPASNTTGSTTLSWDASTGATRYVLRRVSNGAAPVIVYDGSGRTRAESNLLVGTHEYSVKACSGSGEATCSAYSNPPTPFTRNPTGPVAPDPVTSITVSPTTSTDGSYTLSWVPAATGVPAAYYMIYESLGEDIPDCANPCSVFAPATTQGFADRGNGTYRYWVKACVPSACAISPAPVTVEVQRPDGPGRPAFISTTATAACMPNPRSVPLSWGAGSLATHYQIREVDTQRQITRIIEVPGTGTQTSVISRSPGNEPVTFTYEVRALNAANVASAWRGTVTLCVGTSGNDINAPLQSTVRYLHTDALGSPVAETNETGTVVKRTRYEPYGAPTDGIYLDGPGYTGHVTDEATRLTYMQQRYYDPLAGRFLSLDPVTTDPNTGVGFNRYAYANNNPYRFVDPDGRESVEEMINSGAQGCGSVSCAGWAVAYSFWTVLGAEGLSQAYDKGWSSLGTEGKLGAAVEVAAVLPPVKILKEVPLAYKIAADGGKHAGFLARQMESSIGQLNKTIRSLEKQISLHLDKINNPSKYMTKQDPSIPQNVVRAIKDWSSDIQRQTEQLDITKEVLNQKSTVCTGTHITGNC